jgi:DNA-directed RNA polymerase subunit alpha
MKSAVAGVEELISNSYENFDQMYKVIRDFGSQSASSREQLKTYVDSKQESPAADQVIKLAAAALVLENYEQTLALLKNAPEGKEKRWMMSQAFKFLRDYDKALAELDRAKARGWNEIEVLAQVVEINRMAKKMDVAEKALAELKQKAAGSVAYEYQAGEMDAVNGNIETALDHLKAAIEKDPTYLPALFRYAFLLDLNGEEEQAVHYYQECLKLNPVYVNALINLSVLYEDANKYAQAEELLARVLDVYPNHPRCRLFMKDVESSLDMFYDEEYERKRDKFQQVLDMPISDFELSVRSRNCLKKMGIRTLGDLTRITEAELLSYKNFGETSLNEIKAILTSKGLRLGQAVEDKASKKASSILPGGAQETRPAADQALMNKTIDDMQFSVRSRKCLQRLNVNTLGELMNYSESELMSVKNFGSVSLKEVKEKLTEMGLGLRESEI